MRPDCDSGMLEVREEVRRMTTIKETDPVVAGKVTVPEVLTDEQHEAIHRSWEMPAYERGVAPEKPSHRALYVGLLAGALGLAVGAGAGYLAGSQTTSTPAPAPIVITVPVNPNSVNAPTDFGARRVESALPGLNSATDFGARRVESLMSANAATDFGARRVETAQ